MSGRGVLSGRPPPAAPVKFICSLISFPVVPALPAGFSLVLLTAAPVRAWGNLYGSQGLPSEALWSRWQVKCGQKWAELPQPVCLNSLQGLQFLTLSPERTVKATPGHSWLLCTFFLMYSNLVPHPAGFYRQASFYFGK